MAGLYVPKFPPVRADGPDHVPVVCGDPPNDAKRLAEAPLEQKEALPFVPALVAVFTVTVTVAVAAVAQGAVGFTV